MAWKVLVPSVFKVTNHVFLGAEIPAVAGCPGNNFITERFCWKEASKAACVKDPDIGDIGPSGPPVFGISIDALRILLGG